MSLISNQTWKLVDLTIEKNALHNKEVYRVNEDHDVMTLMKLLGRNEW